MSGTLKVHLKAKQRMFLNGALLRVDRKVTIELLNDVAFLLESHVISEDEATTPLRQLYFVVQSLLMEPATRPLALQLYEQTHRSLIASFTNQDILEGLVAVRELIGTDRPFDALKRIRAMLEIERTVLEHGHASGHRIDSAA